MASSGYSLHMLGTYFILLCLIVNADLSTNSRRTNRTSIALCHRKLYSLPDLHCFHVLGGFTLPSRFTAIEDEGNSPEGEGRGEATCLYRRRVELAFYKWAVWNP